MITQRPWIREKPRKNPCRSPAASYSPDRLLEQYWHKRLFQRAVRASLQRVAVLEPVFRDPLSARQARVTVARRFQLPLGSPGAMVPASVWSALPGAPLHFDFETDFQIHISSALTIIFLMSIWVYYHTHLRSAN